MKMKIFEIEIFRNFFDLKIFQFSTLSCSNFLSNQSFLIIFFMDQCKISLRIRWNRLEHPKMHSEKDKRVLPQNRWGTTKDIPFLIINKCTFYIVIQLESLALVHCSFGI